MARFGDRIQFRVRGDVIRRYDSVASDRQRFAARRENARSERVLASISSLFRDLQDLLHPPRQLKFGHRGRLVHWLPIKASGDDRLET